MAQNNEFNVLVTRPVAQAENLCDLLALNHFKAIRFPTLQIVALDKKVIRPQLSQLDRYHWLIFISVNAVNFALSANDGKIAGFDQCSIAAVGKTTAKALKTAGVSVQLVPESQFNTEGLLATGPMHKVANKSCLIIRGKGGREVLANELKARGAKVEYLEVYRRQRPEIIDTTAIKLVQQGKINAITITSTEALTNLMSMIDAENHVNLVLVPIIVVSYRLKEVAVKIGFKQVIVAKSAEDSAIMEAIKVTLVSSN
jgi:uroporphyrinogen-III synthase